MVVSLLVLNKLPKGCFITFCPKRHAKCLTQRGTLLVQYQLLYLPYFLIGYKSGLLKCGILFLNATFRYYKVSWTLKIKSECFVRKHCADVSLEVFSSYLMYNVAENTIPAPSRSWVWLPNHRLWHEVPGDFSDVPLLCVLQARKTTRGQTPVDGEHQVLLGPFPQGKLWKTQ